MKIGVNHTTYAQSNAEYVDNTQNKAIPEIKSNQTETKKQSDSAGTIAIPSEDYENTTYSREEIESDKSQVEESIKEKFLEGMNSCKEMELIPIDENLPHEIYAITISDGKVHVQGGEGYEDKARAYEKLLNASLKYQFQWKWGGRAMDEETVLNSLSDMLKYYSGIDNEIVKNDSSDSIVNHVDEAFDRWYQDNKPARQSFLAKA